MTAKDHLTPYLSFSGEAREALEYYAGVFDGTLSLTTFGEFGMGEDEAARAGIMHGQVEVGGRILLAASDAFAASEVGPSSTSLALMGASEEDDELREWWGRLRQDARSVGVELAEAPWGDHYGQLVDRFGTPWMINISAAVPEGGA